MDAQPTRRSGKSVQTADDHVVGLARRLVDEALAVDGEAVTKVERQRGVAGTCPHYGRDVGRPPAAGLEQHGSDTGALQLGQGGHASKLDRRLTSMWPWRPCRDRHQPGPVVDSE